MRAAAQPFDPDMSLLFSPRPVLRLRLRLRLVLTLSGLSLRSVGWNALLRLKLEA